LIKNAQALKFPEFNYDYPKSMGILLKQGHIVTQNKNDDSFTGDILIENDKISKIKENIEDGNHHIIFVKNLVVTPGFIQSHIHLCQTLFRNLSDDLELLEWLEQHIWPFEMSHTQESLRASARLGLSELLLNGTTSILDMGISQHQEIIFEEMAASGIRGYSGMVMMDTGDQAYKQKTEDIIHQTKKLISSWHNSHEGRIKYALAPRFVPSCSDELWKQVKRLSDQYHLIIHSHASENKDEWQIVKERTGYSNVEFFVKNDLASSHLCLAHCIWVSEQEIQMLADYNINVLHCPSANLKLGSGFAPIPEFISRGINVSLGSDGASCNNNLDIFNEMRLAALIQKPLRGVKTTSAKMIFDMANRGGAKSLGLSEQIGSLEVGKKADLVVMDLNKVHSIPADDIYSQIVYSGKASDILHVMVDGKWRVFDKKLKPYQERTVIQDSWKAIKDLLNRIEST
jgi:cytosine/adenosine deaminase-related metal-dependent hydrolase